jgi:hypothetical protein
MAKQQRGVGAMGISESIKLATDMEIRQLSEDAGRVRGVLDWPDSWADCHLTDFWDVLHFLLAGSRDARDLPLAALKVGDIALVGDADSLESAHAILSTTAKSFAERVAAHSTSDLRARFDPDAMKAAAGVWSGRFWAFPELAEGVFREMLVYYDRLRLVTLHAAERREGLIFYRYESL